MMKQINSIILLFMVLSLVFISLSCEDDPPTVYQQTPELSITPSTLDFGSFSDSLSFSIANIGVDTLTWDISTNVGWITISPSNGTTTSEFDRITLLVNRDSLENGDHGGMITISSNGGNGTVTVSMWIPSEEADLLLSKTMLNFEEDDTQLLFQIANGGLGTLTWDISHNQDWISISPISGSLYTDEYDQVMVTVDRDNLRPNRYSGTITVNSNGGTETIAVVLTVPAERQLFWSYSFDEELITTAWNCFDTNDEGTDGDDYWDIYDAGHDGEWGAWCATQGTHPLNNYDNNMTAWMLLKPSQAVNIENYYDIIIRFWMAYDIREGDDVTFNIQETDGSWYYVGDRTKWSGGDFGWDQYEIPLSWWGEGLSTSQLRMAFIFDSNSTGTARGVIIDSIEIWGRPRG